MLGSLSRLFGVVVDRRNRRFDEGRRAIVRVDRPVISVGNLTVGGTGKTPVVQMISRMLQDLRLRPAVVLRGYRRSSRGLLVVHDGHRVLASAREAGDEALLHARVLDVPVVVAESKVDAAVHAAGFLPCDVIIVDDGFQHRALHRDVDVVLVDRATLDDPRLLPAGRLREPLANLYRADVVLLTGGDVQEHEVRPYLAPDAVVGRIQVVAHVPELAGRSVVTMCGIANPERFERTVRGCGADVVASITFKDHHAYVRSDIERVLRTAQHHQVAVVTTEKDRVKLDQALELFTQANVELIVLSIEARLVDGAEAVETLIISRIPREDRHLESRRE